MGQDGSTARVYVSGKVLSYLDQNLLSPGAVTRIQRLVNQYMHHINVLFCNL